MNAEDKTKQEESAAMHDDKSEVALTSVPISALQYFSYCPHQCALIHVQRLCDENIYTTRGQLGHERADNGSSGLGRVVS